MKPPHVEVKVSENIPEKVSEEPDTIEEEEDIFEFQKKKKKKGKKFDANLTKSSKNSKQPLLNIAPVDKKEETNLPPPPPGIEIRLTLVPHVESPEKNHSSVALNIVLPLDYPSKSVPWIRVEKIKGLSDKESEGLQRELDNLATKLFGRVMVYELAEKAVEYLKEHNQANVSFYEQMMSRQQNAVSKDKKTGKKGKVTLTKSGNTTLEDAIQAELDRQFLRKAYDDENVEEEDVLDYGEIVTFEEEGEDQEIQTPEPSYSSGNSAPDTPPLKHVPIKWKRVSTDENQEELGITFSALNLETKKMMTVREINYLFSTDIREEVCKKSFISN